MTLFLLVLLAAFVFEYINGFHDAANSIATIQVTTMELVMANPNGRAISTAL